MALFLTIVLDGVGIGAQLDAADYGDEGSHTLGNVCAQVRPRLPNLESFGLGCISPLEGVPCVESPRASFGRMQEVSEGKDSTTGHWELAGLQLDHPFPVYPDGFPDALVRRFLKHTRVDGFLGNRAASGTAIIAELGDEHVATGHPIIYTSADSVFQIAAHTDVIPLKHLYRICEITRSEVCINEDAVGRVIARPFTGDAGNYQRVASQRKDYSLLPPADTLQETLQVHHVETVSIGKIYDLFGGVGFDRAVKTSTNAEGIAAILAELMNHGGGDVFLWTNLVDFDQNYGHRNDPVGFARALEEFDEALPAIAKALPDSSRLLITADHGNDPTTPSTDHSREYVPLLLYGGDVAEPLGHRSSFNDHAATVAEFFDVPFPKTGASFLR